MAMKTHVFVLCARFLFLFLKQQELEYHGAIWM